MKTTHEHFHIVFPEDTNHMGTIFGGKLVSIMDLAVAQHTVILLKESNSECNDAVTVSFKNIEFLIGPKVGDLLKVTSSLTRIGIKSLTFNMLVERVNDNKIVARGETTFVARKDGIAHPHNLSETGKNDSNN